MEVLLGHYSSALTSLAISASGNMLATADRDGRVRISVLPPTGTAGGMHEVLCYCLGHTAFVTCCAFMPMPGGELLLSGGGDGTLRMWQPRTGQQLQCLHLSAAGNNLTAVLDVAVSSNGRHVAAIVDGRDAVFLTRKASQADATLEEGTWFSLAGLHIPSQLHFDGSDRCVVALSACAGVAQVCLISLFSCTCRLWVVGGPPSDSSTRTYLMCASVTPEGKLRDVLASLVPADMRAEAEGGQGAEAAESGAPRRLLSAHLAKHAYSQDDIEHRKRQRRDKKL